MVDYPCAKFGDFSFSRFGFIVRKDRQTDTHTRRITDDAKRFTLATVVGVSKYLTYRESAYTHITIAPNSPPMLDTSRITRFIRRSAIKSDKEIA